MEFLEVGPVTVKRPTKRLSEESARSKRTLILDAAVDHFGQTGFELTKWATIADQVGIGQTALYHYFESKSHCLLTIMHLELAQSLERFQAATHDVGEADAALRAAVLSAYQGATERDALQRRILQNHIDVLATPRLSEREEAERQHSRALVREIEFEWSVLIRRGMDSGVFARQDARLAAHMVLGLVVSVWRWYRPSGPYELDQVAETIADGCLKLLKV